jgi:hypothetical protein
MSLKDQLSQDPNQLQKQLQGNLIKLYDTSHIWCKHAAEAKLLLHLNSLSAETLSKPKIRDFFIKNNAQLSSCGACVEAYHASFEEYKVALLGIYKEESVNILAKTLEEKDVLRISEALKGSDSEEPSVPLFELLQFPHLLNHQQTLEAFEAKISRNLKTMVPRNARGEIPDLTFWFLFHKEAKLRVWARRVISDRQLLKEQFLKLRPLFQKIISKLGEDDEGQAPETSPLPFPFTLSTFASALWKGMDTLMLLFSSQVLSDFVFREKVSTPFFPLTLAGLSLDKFTLTSCLRILTHCWKELQQDFWSEETRHLSPEKCFHGIISHVAARELRTSTGATSKGEREIAIQWWIPFLCSLPEKDLGLHSHSLKTFFNEMVGREEVTREAKLGLQVAHFTLITLPKDEAHHSRIDHRLVFEVAFGFFSPPPPPLFLQILISNLLSSLLLFHPL